MVNKRTKFNVTRFNAISPLVTPDRQGQIATETEVEREVEFLKAWRRETKPHRCEGCRRPHRVLRNPQTPDAIWQRFCGRCAEKAKPCEYCQKPFVAAWDWQYGNFCGLYCKA